MTSTLAFNWFNLHEVFSDDRDGGARRRTAIHAEKHICDPYGDFGRLNFNSDLRAREVRIPEGDIERAD